jgi:hypothetical protein
VKRNALNWLNLKSKNTNYSIGGGLIFVGRVVLQFLEARCLILIPLIYESFFLCELVSSVVIFLATVNLALF